MDPGGVESGSSSVSPQDVGSKNEKTADPAVENPVNLTSSMTEFPCHEPHPLNSGTSVKSELEEKDEPAACQLGELLSSNLETIFRNAVENIVECGYDEDAAEKAISSHGLYLAGEDPVKNIVNDTLNILKEAKEDDILTDQKFGDFQQLVEYTMLEMINAVGKVKPFPFASEAMRCLLICDLNMSVACESEGDKLTDSGCEEVPRESSFYSSSQLSLDSHSSETLKFGSFKNVPEPKTALPLEGSISEKESQVAMSGAAESVQNISQVSISVEKSATGQQGRSKKEYALFWQKHMPSEKYRAYGRGAFGTGRLATIGGFLMEKRLNPLVDAPFVHKKISSSEVQTDSSVLADGSCHALTTSRPDVPVTGISSTLLSEKKIVVPSSSTDSRLSLSSYFEQKSPSKLEGTSSTSIQTSKCDAQKEPAPRSGGTSVPHVPHDKRDDLILDLVLKLESLQVGSDCWNDWANRMVMEACNQVEMAISSAKTLEVGRSRLKKELEAAKLKEVESAARIQEAMKKEMQAPKDAKSCEREIALLQEERQEQKPKVAELQRSVSRAIELRNRAEARLKHEIKVTEDFLAQATSFVEKQREQLEAAAEAKELKMKRNAEKGKQKLEESELNMMLDSLKLERECKMCMSAECTVVFDPCGHQIFCVECNKLHMQMTWECPICRRMIKDRIEVKLI